MTEKTMKEKKSNGTSICHNEAALVWDEYKYRHDLIWRHLIRSAIAVVALITVAYSTSFDENRALFVVAAILAVGYSAFNIRVVNLELVHYWRVKGVHQARQAEVLGLPSRQKMNSHFSGFAGRVNFVLIALLVLALTAASAQVLP
jgi:hypothetical protein